MKCEITVEGTLVVYVETITEEYAMNKWFDWNGSETGMDYNVILIDKHPILVPEGHIVVGG